MPIQLPSDLMVSVSGFRGRVGAPLVPELVGGIAAAFGAFMRHCGEGRTILVARDSRTSGPMFAQATVAGLMSVGCKVVDLGVVPTPTLMLAVERADAIGGICVTASHNPAEWNALKFAGPEGMFLNQDRMSEFLAFLRDADPARASWDALQGIETDDSSVASHLAALLELSVLDVPTIRARGLKVTLDCVHGASGPMMLELLAELGCSVTSIGTEPDGLFPRDPEPTAANLSDLATLVRESGSDVGLAVDPDGDRLSLVDETGGAIGEDYTLAFASAAVLERASGTVVTNLSTSQVVEDVATRAGATFVRAPVGEINVATRMKELGAVIGGEGNGGVILPALHLTRDAPVAAALVLQHLVDGGVTLCEAVEAIPSYDIVKAKVSFPRERLEAAYTALKEASGGADIDLSDGLWLRWATEHRWMHVRPSGTEPVVRVIAEAPSGQEAMEMVEQGRAVLDRLA